MTKKEKKMFDIRNLIECEIGALSSRRHTLCKATLKTNSDKKLEEISKELLNVERRYEMMQTAYKMLDQLIEEE